MNNTKGKNNICLIGGMGRMGQRLQRLLHDDAQYAHLKLHTLLVRTPVASSNTHVIQYIDPHEAMRSAHIAIDFSAPAYCQTIAPICAKLGVAYVVASTALQPEDIHAIDAAAAHIPLLVAANLSIGVNVMLEIVKQAVALLPDFDIEISEMHHRHKQDAPSGTAYALGAAVQAATARTLQAIYSRYGNNTPRTADSLGYSTLRGGNVAGEHTVYLLGESERLEITHRSQSADIFAAGALHAATWLVQQKPGRYDMRDVLFKTNHL